MSGKKTIDPVLLRGWRAQSCNNYKKNEWFFFFSFFYGRFRVVVRRPLYNTADYTQAFFAICFSFAVDDSLIPLCFVWRYVLYVYARCIYAVAMTFGDIPFCCEMRVLLVFVFFWTRGVFFYLSVYNGWIIICYKDEK